MKECMEILCGNAHILRLGTVLCIPTRPLTLRVMENDFEVLVLLRSPA